MRKGMFIGVENDPPEIVVLLDLAVITPNEERTEEDKSVKTVEAVQNKDIESQKGQMDRHTEMENVDDNKLDTGRRGKVNTGAQ